MYAFVLLLLLLLHFFVIVGFDSFLFIYFYSCFIAVWWIPCRDEKNIEQQSSKKNSIKLQFFRNVWNKQTNAYTVVWQKHHSRIMRPYSVACVRTSFLHLNKFSLSKFSEKTSCFYSMHYFFLHDASMLDFLVEFFVDRQETSAIMWAVNTFAHIVCHSFVFHEFSI